jgi:hydrogenase nickel incorporation protein HypA/HybF
MNAVMDMHEWSLAEGVLAAVVEHQQKNKMKKVCEVRIRLGELQRVERDIFRYALKEIAKLKGMDIRIRIETEKAILRCRGCGHRWKLSESEQLDEEKAEMIHFLPEVAHAYIGCPVCRSPDFEIVAGRGVVIKSIKGVR